MPQRFRASSWKLLRYSCRKEIMETEKEQSQNKKRVSRGEKLFNWLTYGGIAGVGTFIATVPLAFWTKYGKGAKMFENISHKMHMSGISEHTTEQIMTTTALMQGGNVMLFPVKYAEDHKAEIVGKINAALGEDENCAKPEVHDKQTWGSIVKARAVAWGVTFGSFYTAAKLLGGERIEQFKGRFSEKLCKVLGKAVEHQGKETKSFKYGKIAAEDVFATIASAGLLFIGSRVFSRWNKQKKHMKHENEDERPVVPSSIAVVSDTDVSDHSSSVASRIIASHKPESGFAASLSQRATEAAQLGV